MSIVFLDGNGATKSLSSDTIAGVDHQTIKLEYGDGSTATRVDAAVVGGGLPVRPGLLTWTHLVTAATDNAMSIKAGAGTLHAVHIYNNAGYPVYVKFHNTAGVPTAGAGVVFGIGVQAGQQRDWTPPGGRAFATGIGMTVVKDITDAGATAVALSDALIEVGVA